MATFTFRIRFSKWPAPTHVATRMMTLTELTVENRRLHSLTQDEGNGDPSTAKRVLRRYLITRTTKVSSSSS
jgi:hypothetical protein